MAEGAATKHAQLRQAIGPAMGYLTTIVEMGVLKTFVDYNVFDMIPDEGSISIPELSKKVGGSQEIIERMAPYLIAASILASPAPDHVAHTDKSRIYKSGELTAGFVAHVFNMLFRPMAQLPKYFAQHGLASPKHANLTPFGLATGHPDKDVYEILTSDAEMGKVFNGFIGRVGTVFPMNGVYDFRWMQEQSGILSEKRPIFVDIGGSNGLALRDILSDNTFISTERCAVLDLPKTIENTRSNLDESLRSLQLVGGSVFEPLPQPVRGAVVYQFRRILNDFADDDVLRAWRSVRDAAAPDTRVYVVEELLQSNRNTFAVAQDLSLMLVGGKRRNAAMHSELAATAGFRLNTQFPDKVNDCEVLEFVVA